MSRCPFCFVHATNVRLDQPMWGIGEVSGEPRRLVEEATNLAFQQIIETCVEQNAAFLLLTGNTIDTAHGQRARLLLEQACERLAECDTQVFLMPGESDPPHAWGNDQLLPENLTVFLPDHLVPVPVIRERLTLATIQPYQDRQYGLIVPGKSTSLRVALIGGRQHSELQQELASDTGGQLDVKRLDRYPNLAGFDYLALGSGNERITVTLPCGLAHDPGCPQPLDGQNTTSLGCTLVEIDGDDQLQTHFVPTAVVRREEIEIHQGGDQTWDDLAEAMQSALVKCLPLPTERLWMIRWILDGEGDVLDSLCDHAAQKELAELIEAERTDHHDLLRCHEIEVRPRWSDQFDSAGGGSIYEDFLALFSEQVGEHLVQFQRGLPSRDWPESDWAKHVIEAAQQATQESVQAHARDLAWRHLISEEREAA